MQAGISIKGGRRGGFVKSLDRGAHIIPESMNKYPRLHRHLHPPARGNEAQKKLQQRVNS